MTPVVQMSEHPTNEDTPTHLLEAALYSTHGKLSFFLRKCVSAARGKDVGLPFL